MTFYHGDCKATFSYDGQAVARGEPQDASFRLVNGNQKFMDKTGNKPMVFELLNVKDENSRGIVMWRMDLSSALGEGSFCTGYAKERAADGSNVALSDREKERLGWMLGASVRERGPEGQKTA
jgi:hypothetical protein